jgi:CubicO group peptidase (beta-lactamase class C family)/prolipoprotein diacylglyceryltransferase
MRLVRRDRRLIGVYFGGVLGAFTGAKIVYLLAEGWQFWNSPDRWLIWATGKTILGALLGGYAGVELAKRVVEYQQPTGDLFAIVAPIGIVLGRIGCLLHGCCLGIECSPSPWSLRDIHGVHRWPAVPAEILFNVVALGSLVVLRRRGLLPGQHFHLYLMSYGSFRFFHEFVRATPRLNGGLTGYQWAALACVALGGWGFYRRREKVRHRREMGVAGLVAGALVLGGATSFAAEDYQTKLDQIREKNNVPGLAAAAIREGETLFVGVSGFRQAGSPDAVTRDDLWHIGSCTKSMTATLAGVLVDEKVINWEAKIADVLPEFRGEFEKGWETATLEQLLQNRGGAPKEPPPDAWALAFKGRGSPVEQRLAFLGSVLRQKPAAPPGTANIYSNQGFALAGAMLERAAKKPYEDLLREKVFKPLGMKSCGYGPPGTTKGIDQPRGHRGSSGNFTPVQPGVDADNPAAITPAGRVHCTIADLARFASWHARGPLRDVKLMSDATFQRLHAAPQGQEYAMGWSVAQRDWAGGTTWSHNGSNSMWFAVMWIAPEKQAAYVAATNVAGDTGAKVCDDAVAMLIRGK